MKQQFLILFVGKELVPDDGSEKTQKYMAKWAAWMTDLTRKDIILSGAPLAWNGMVVKKKGVKALDLQDVDIGGYMVIRAKDLKEAQKIASTAPNVEIGGTVVVRPIMPAAS